MTQQDETAPLLIKIEDLDKPIYRIFPLWFFEKALQQKQLTLLSPQSWEDPFEILAERIMMTDQSTKPSTHQPLEPYLDPVYAQCWSQTEESDTLLRAYSRVVKDPHFDRNTAPREEGVKVRSTPRKLIKTVQSWADKPPDITFVIGAVQYYPEAEITQKLANYIGKHGPQTVGHGQYRAKMMLFKRQAFSHENEVRLMAVDGHNKNQQSLLSIPFEPSDVFEAVTFDPRLAPFERKERVAVAKDLGFEGEFDVSGLYR